MPPLHPVFTQSSIDPTDGKQSSAGWLEHFPRIVGALGILVAFGHSLLAMSGEESLAQVNREIEAPKLKNLMRAGFVIFLYSMLLTSLMSFLAVLIIPDGKRVMTQIVTNGTATTDDSRGQTWWEVDYLRKGPAVAGHAATSWGYLIQRTTDSHGESTPVTTRQIVEVNPALQHVERDNGGYRDNLINGLVQNLLGPVVDQDHHGMLRGGRRIPDPRRRGQHQHGRIQRRAEPAGGRRRAHALVPASAPALRHHAPPDQYGRDPAAHRHRRQHGRREHAGRSLRLWRDLVVRVHDDVDGRAALQGPLAAPISRAAEYSIEDQERRN